MFKILNAGSATYNPTYTTGENPWESIPSDLRINTPIPEGAVIILAGDRMSMKLSDVDSTGFSIGEGAGYTDYPKIVNWSVLVPSSLSSISGSVSITPSAANTPTSVSITFSSSFDSTPKIFLTAHTSVPGTQVTGVGTSNISNLGFTLWLSRTNVAATTVDWLAVV